jgi:hypothetical protein
MSNSKDNIKIEANVFDIEEIYSDCTVQILKNSTTGEISVGWWKNDRKPKNADR